MSKKNKFLPFWTDILLVFFHFGIEGLSWTVLNIVNINQINFRGWWPLGLNFGLCPGLRRWGFWWCSMLKRILTLSKCIKNVLHNYQFLNEFLTVSKAQLDCVQSSDFLRSTQKFAQFSSYFVQWPFSSGQYILGLLQIK